ncbi:MAG: hypothetical protein JST43_04925 [Bacteroidetes bacterium]|nr:hypothetical protein [Bacteroidota bacterium]MBS1539832.1 hypothetical protein [Bacteroidota bacterium]
MTDKPAPNQNILHTVALTILEVSTIASLIFLLIAGQHQSSWLLKLLFVGWVFSSFAGLFMFERHFKQSAYKVQRRVQRLLIGVSLASLIFYSTMFLPALTKPAFIFLLTPLLSWMLIVISFFVLRQQDSEQ